MKKGEHWEVHFSRGALRRRKSVSDARTPSRTRHCVRDAMPGVVRARRFVPRVRTGAGELAFDEAVYGDHVAFRHVFDRGGEYWADVVLDELE